jgi:thymidylate kinase
MFSLDDFEREILKGMLVKKYDSYNKIVENTDMSKQVRQEGLKNLEIEFIKSLSVILSPDEITTYVDTDFTDKAQKKKKKRRKRKKIKNE